MGVAPWAAALLLVGGASSHDQTLTESRFVETCLTNHPAIAAAEASVGAASGARRQAGVLANPELAWEREEAEATARQTTWSMSWRLPFDGRGHRLEAADEAIAAAQSAADASRLETRRETQELFAAWYIASEREAVIKDHLDHASRLETWLRDRAQQGEAAGVEARRLTLEVEVLSRQLAAARAEALAHRAAAATWSELVTPGIRPGRPGLAPPPDSVEVGGSPGLEALAHRVAESEARHELSKHVLEPPEISVGWTEIRDGTQSFDGPVFALAWPVPLFDRNRGNRAVAAAEADRSRQELREASSRAAQRADAALASYSTLYRAASSGGTAASDGIVEPIWAAFEAGEMGLTDLLDALRTSAEVRLSRLETLADSLAAERELEAAIGRPLTPGGRP